MTSPRFELGDVCMSPLFHRVETACPVLHLFGYVNVHCTTATATCASGRPSSVLSDSGGCRDSTHTLTSASQGSLVKSLRACLHVHGVYPYFLVPQYDSGMSCIEFGAQLETVMQRMWPPNGRWESSRQPGNASTFRRPPPAQLIHNVELIDRMPFYGYHGRPHRFFKVSVANPHFVQCATGVLHETKHVGGRRWQVYEGHTPFHSQFMTDCGVMGIAPLCISRCQVRCPIPVEWSSCTVQKLRATYGITKVYDTGDIERLTQAEVEMDIVGQSLREERSGWKPGENLVAVRRMIRHYFAENGVPDTLRTQFTIAAEEKQQEAWRQGVSEPSDPALLRYGTVLQVQRNELSVTAMRARMQKIVRARAALQQHDDAIKHEERNGHRNRRSWQVAYLGPSLKIEPQCHAKHEVQRALQDGNDGLSQGGSTLSACELQTYELLDALADDSHHVEQNTDPTQEVRGLSLVGAFSTQKEQDSSDKLGYLADVDVRDHSQTGDQYMLPVERSSSVEDVIHDCVSVASSSCSTSDKGDELALLPLSAPASQAVTVPCTPSHSFFVGDDVAFVQRLNTEHNDDGGNDDRDSSRVIGVYAARIVSLSTESVWLQWLVGLQETPFAADADVLIRRHRWVPSQPWGQTRGTDCVSLLQCGELLLTEAIDENPVSVLSSMSASIHNKVTTTLYVEPCPLKLFTRLSEYKSCSAQERHSNATLAIAYCRYTYSLASQILMPILSLLPDGLVQAGSMHAAKTLSHGHGTRVSRRAFVALPERLIENGDGCNTTGEEFVLVESSSSDSGDSSVVVDKRNAGGALWEPTDQNNTTGDTVDCGDVLHLLQQRIPLRRSTRSRAANAALCLSQKRNSVHQDFLKATQCDSVELLSHAANGNPRRISSSMDVRSSAFSHSLPSVIATNCISSVSPPDEPYSAPSVECLTPSQGHLLQAPAHQKRLITSSSIPDALFMNTNCATFGLSFHGGVCCCTTSPVVHVTGATWPYISPAATGTTVDVAAPAKPFPELPFYTQITTHNITPPRVPASLSSLCRKSVHARTPHSVLSTRSLNSRQKFALCPMRIVYMEVLIRRQGGGEKALEDEVLAVAIGKTYSTQKKIAVHVWCVKARGAQQSLTLSGAPTMECSHGITVEECSSEAGVLSRVAYEIASFDPDILASWDGIRYGFGFFSQRYRLVFQRNFSKDLSRLVPHSESPFPLNLVRCQANGVDSREATRPHSLVKSPIQLEEVPEERLFNSLPSSMEVENREKCPADGGLGTEFRRDVLDPHTVALNYEKRFGATMRIAGRICVSLGSTLRSEVHTLSHTLQMVHMELIGHTIPYFSDVCLTELYENGGPGERLVVLQHLVKCLVGAHRVEQHIRFYRQLSEFSRMYGILLEEVMSRGSQYRVEATLHRMTRASQYVMLSPTREQVYRQPRIQCIPYIMQPRSGFYKDDPVVVLDFRSLYPSVIIAYNICYSTCLGLVQTETQGRLGVLPNYKQDNGLLATLVPDDGVQHDCVTISPNGAMFVKPCTRKGVLPQMVQSVLDARFEVQAALNHVANASSDDVMEETLQGQQLALKLLANVTYGYTAASYTGRMPCVDIADAIVSLSRQTLERAIALIHSTQEWHAEVVYSDTDSVFVRLPGRSLADAFALGEAMAKAVTASNPAPIKFQLERVFLPCLLLVKKRYVGYAWSHPNQKEPAFVAKGIETVRRDQCPATTKITQQMIRLFFAGASPEQLRAQFFYEVGKLQRGDCNPSECIFRRGVKLGKYRSDAQLPLGAHLAMQLMEKDLSRTPYWGERLPYVVARSLVSDSLRDQVMHPQQLLHLEASHTLDAEYYIQRHINPTLDRIFYLVGISFTRWYNEMPRKRATQLNLYYNGWFAHQEVGPDTRLVAGKRPRDGHGMGYHDAVQGEVNDCAIVVDGTVTHEASSPVASINSAPHHWMPRAHWAKNTLDAYCPRILCVVCHGKVTPLQGRQPQQRSFSTAPGTDSALPICAPCLANPQEVYCYVLSRSQHVTRRLQAVEQACLYCIGGSGEVGGPQWLARPRDVGDIEELPHVAVPRHLANAVSGLPEINDVCTDEPQTSIENSTHGCTSIDCPLTFEKKRLTLLRRQLQLLGSRLHVIV